MFRDVKKGVEKKKDLLCTEYGTAKVQGLYIHEPKGQKEGGCCVVGFWGERKSMESQLARFGIRNK